MTFKNVELTVLPRERKQDQKYLFEFSNARNVDFRDVTVDWAQANPDQWRGLLPEDAPVNASDVVERGTHP